MAFVLIAAYCQVAVCHPSRASLMTGQQPDHLGVWTLPIHFREAQPNAVTMPQWFRQHGYTAVSHGKIYHNPTPDPQSWSEPIRERPDLPYPYPASARQAIREGRRALPDGDWRKNSLRGPSTAAPDLPDDQVLDGAQTRMAIEEAPAELLEELESQLLSAHPRRPLSLLPAIHSSPEGPRIETKLTLTNGSGSPTQLYPISVTGRRGRAQTIAPDATLERATTMGSVFVAESEDGRVHETLSASIPPRAITLE